MRKYIYCFLLSGLVSLAGCANMPSKIEPTLTRDIQSTLALARYGSTNTKLPAVIPAPPGNDVRARLVITAPGDGAHDYKLLPIDLRNYPQGGTLRITVHLHRDSATAGSFDLFQDGVVIPVSGRPTTSMGGRYDVSPGTRFRLIYTFSKPQIVLLGAEGNWFSPKGASGMIDVSVDVSPAGVQPPATASSATMGAAVTRELASHQVWTGSYVCAGHRTPLRLVIAEVASEGRETPYGDGRFASAVFDFGGHGSRVPHGSYRVEGAVLDGGQVRFAPWKWIHRPAGYVMVGLKGQVTPTGAFEGRILHRGCGAFVLHLQHAAR